jgi:hypothetical protein
MKYITFVPNIREDDKDIDIVVTLPVGSFYIAENQTENEFLVTIIKTDKGWFIDKKTYKKIKAQLNGSLLDRILAIFI